MKINFQNQDYSGINLQSSDNSGAALLNRDYSGVGFAGSAYTKNKAAAGSGIKAENGVRMDIGNSVSAAQNNLFTSSDESTGKGKSLAELAQEAGNIDAGVSRDYRTVLSNTLSPEDYAKASEEGFDLSAMDPEDVVTIQDKVKAEVAKGGEIIEGYNDDLSAGTAKEVFGSELAENLIASFKKADLPMTDSNVENIEKSWQLASKLEPVSEDNVRYMIENQMDPTIWNFYIAENNGTASQINSAELDLDDDANKGLLRQIENIVLSSGRTEENGKFDEGMESAKWLLDNNFPVTAENIDNYETINAVQLPVTEESFVDAVTAAVSRGTDPVFASLAEDESIYDMAVTVERKYFSSEEWEKAAGDITARRQLEEVRLSMTAEVNVKLLESGFSIDTAPMEDLIEALKNAEKEVAKNYFVDFAEDEEKAVSSYRLMNETNRIVSDLQTAPAAALGGFTFKSADEISLKEFSDNSRSLRDTYEKAGESYEALMTAPRADLGDNIRKAFTNAGELLKETGLEETSENLRAVRILGYNGMEISSENIARVTEADEMVQNVVSKMTPAGVLNMIRDGINPLETDFASLTVYFDSQLTNGYEETAKDYSEFLYGLDRQDGITEEEREAFIGTYRLIDKIEKSDGAVIGAVINEQAEMNFSNLLSAVRSNRVKKIDVRVNDEFGGTADILRIGKSITAQISSAFAPDRYSEELEELRKAADVSSTAVQVLEGLDMTESADNLIAMDELLSADSNLFEELLGKENSSKAGAGKNAAVKSGAGKNAARTSTGVKTAKDAVIKNGDGSDADDRSIVDRISDALEDGNLDSEYSSIMKDFESLSEELTDESENYVDVKALSLIHRQLGFAMQIADRGNVDDRKDYIVPMEIGDTVSKVHLSFKNGNEGEAFADIYATVDEDESFCAHLSIRDGLLDGYLVGNSESELKKLGYAADIFVEAVKENESLKDLNLGEFGIVSGNTEDSDWPGKDNSKSGKDAGLVNSDGSERTKLMQATRLLLQSLGRA